MTHNYTDPSKPCICGAGPHQAHADVDTFIVRVWPDGTAVSLEDLRDDDYDFMSDDFTDVNVNDPSQISNLDAQERAAVLDCIA